MIIYKITNLIDSKIYIGQTTRKLSERIREHFNPSSERDKKSHLHRALNLYGKNYFKFEIIDTANSIDELNEKEIYWIDFYKSTNKEIGYNKKQGGLNGKHIPESIEKIKEAGRNRIFKESTREKLKKNIPPNHTGKKRSEETRRKMSESQKGRKQPLHVIEALRLSNIGRKQSEETILKRSQKLKGMKKPEGMMEKLRLNNIGKKRSEETRLKISIATIGKCAGEKNHKSILKNIQVIEIKKRLKDGEKICILAKEFNVKNSTIKNIKYGLSWKNI